MSSTREMYIAVRRAKNDGLVEAIMFHQPPIVNWCCNAFYVPSEQLYIYTGYLYHQLEPGANVSIGTALL